MNNNHFDIEICRPSQAEIAARAYELYVQHGRREGRAHEDWLQAETELLQLSVSKPVACEKPISTSVEPPKADKKPSKSKTTIMQDREVSFALPKRSATSRMKRIKLA